MRISHRSEDATVNPVRETRIVRDTQISGAPRAKALEARNGAHHGRVTVLADVRENTGCGGLGLGGERRPCIERRDTPITGLDDANHSPFTLLPSMHLTVHSTAGSPLALGSPLR